MILLGLLGMCMFSGLGYERLPLLMDDKKKFRVAIWYVSGFFDSRFHSSIDEISGGGIGGLTCAVAFSKYSDIAVDIYESAAQFSEIGAGVGMCYVKAAFYVSALDTNLIQILRFPRYLAAPLEHPQGLGP